ncbi:MAG: hypothetical protein ACLSF6_05300 [Evtepia gabavorous]
MLLGLLRNPGAPPPAFSHQGLTRRNLQNLLVTALGTGTPPGRRP